jgi:hypothetical protein
MEFSFRARLQIGEDFVSIYDWKCSPTLSPPAFSVFVPFPKSRFTHHQQTMDKGLWRGVTMAMSMDDRLGSGEDMCSCPMVGANLHGVTTIMSMDDGLGFGERYTLVKSSADKHMKRHNLSRFGPS